MNTIKNLTIEIKKKFVVIQGRVDGPLRNIWFVFTTDEFSRFAKGSCCTFSDGYHKLDTFVELCTFYNLEIPRATNGTIEVPYFRCIIPLFLRRAIDKLARRIVPTLGDDDVYTITPDSKRVDRWTRLYGQGTGQVEVEVDDRVLEKYEASIGNESFDRNIEHLKQIALNGTSCWLHKSKVSLSYDHAGFMFGVPGLWGGLINHGTAEKPDWSLHT